MFTYVDKISVVILTLLFSVNTMAEKDNFDIVTDSLKLPRTQSSAKHAASSNDQGQVIPLGTAEFPGLCKYRGHVGKFQCIEVNAIKHGRYSCKGKDLYFSKINGKKACYSCPSGYKRASLTRKMTHKKACEKHQKGKNLYSKATKVGNVGSCSKGQFKHDGFCKTCPAKSKRKHIAGIDKGKCKVEREYRCNAGLSLHKSEPRNIWGRARNWLGLKHKKYCGLPFDLKAYGSEIVASEANKKVIEGLIILGKALAEAKGATAEKVEKIRKAIKRNKLKEAYNLLIQFPEYEALKASLAESGAHFSQSAAERRKFAVTVGFVTDGSFVFGGNYEFGIAYDVSAKRFKKYKSYGLTKGVSVAIDGAVTVGIWKGEFVDSYTQGFTVGIPVAKLGYSVSADGGLGIWSDYYTPKRADGLNQPHFVGVSGSFGVGSGFEIGEYSEIWTDVKD